MKDSQAVLYNKITKELRIIDKQEVCNLLKDKSAVNMTYKEIAKKFNFNKPVEGIYGISYKENSLIFLIDKTINELKKFLGINDSDIILYHGSNGGIVGILQVKYKDSDSINDFGQGFYLSTNKPQAENRVQNSPNPVLYTYKLNISNYRLYEFSDDILWALFIGYNRERLDFTNYPKILKKLKEINSYDIIKGNIADDKIAKAYSGFLRGEDTDTVLIESLKLIKYGKQYTIKNQEVINNNYLKEVSKYQMTKDDRKRALMWGQNIKSSMENDLENIKLKYRRQGKYIDELMEQYEKSIK